MRIRDWWAANRPFKVLPWSEDDWLSNQGSILILDKVEHVIREIVLTVLVCGVLYDRPAVSSFVLVEIFGILWEVVRDGMFPAKRGGVIQGASGKDLVANNVGILIGALILWAFGAFNGN